MEQETKINALVNVGQSKVVEKAYDDIASPAGRKLGLALSTVVDIGNTILFPIRWVNERARIYFENNLKKYEQKLTNISEEDVITVPSEISRPILDRFTYVSNEDISNAFVQLLASASSTSSASLAHPAFVSIIDRISPDEARLLKYFKVELGVPCLTLAFYTDNTRTAYTTAIEEGTALEGKLNLFFPSNISIYFENLCSLGVLQKTTYHWQQFSDTYGEIEKYYSVAVEADQPTDINSTNVSFRRIERKEMFVLTNFGGLFCRACIE